jgi:hypothetical protein
VRPFIALLFPLLAACESTREASKPAEPAETGASIALSASGAVSIDGQELAADSYPRERRAALGELARRGLVYPDPGNRYTTVCDTRVELELEPSCEFSVVHELVSSFQSAGPGLWDVRVRDAADAEWLRMPLTRFWGVGCPIGAPAPAKVVVRFRVRESVAAPSAPLAPTFRIRHHTLHERESARVAASWKEVAELAASKRSNGWLAIDIDVDPRTPWCEVSPLVAAANEFGVDEYVFEPR